ncbi:MAG: plasmid mobilization relaxosome protein MobC [Proteobacteria bacterium]|nr:plasmid mobilization relaxosome protein MobC [Pseudomonadota bacterium]
MPAKGTSKPADMRRARRPKVAFSDDELARVKDAAKASRRTLSRFMRESVLAATGEGVKPKMMKGRNSQDLLHALHVLAVQVRKHGTNVNQLAHQANAGMVPVTRREIEYVLNMEQVLLSKATAAVESLLA